MPHRFGAWRLAQRLQEEDCTTEVTVVDGRAELHEAFVQSVRMLGGTFQRFDFSATLVPLKDNETCMQKT